MYHIKGSHEASMGGEVGCREDLFMCVIEGCAPWKKKRFAHTPPRILKFSLFVVFSFPSLSFSLSYLFLFY